jgi:hypothetical protein
MRLSARQKSCKKTQDLETMDNGKPDHNEAQAMLELCTSVGARAVDLTLTNSAGEKEWFRRNLPLVELRRMLPEKLDDATARKRNVIIRPHGPGVTSLQPDDLKAAESRGEENGTLPIALAVKRVTSAMAFIIGASVLQFAASKAQTRDYAPLQKSLRVFQTR